MQFFGKPPLGVVYCTTMSRPDAALALALAYGYEGKREARMASIAVSNAGLATAQFCDVVVHFYAGRGQFMNSNRFLPIGMVAEVPPPSDSPMVKAVLERKNEKGTPVFEPEIHRVTDTSEPSAMIRNSLTGQGTAVVILSAPATSLARSLALPGVRELVAAKVKMLVVVDVEPAKDVAALQRILADWPTPVVLCGSDIGEALPFPGASVDKDFAWSPDHPVADAYRAFKTMPYDAPSWDMAAVLHAVHPETGFFDLSEPGRLQVSEEGRVNFAAAADGKHRRLVLKPDQKDKIVQTYVEIASAKLPQRPGRRPPAD